LAFVAVAFAAIPGKITITGPDSINFAETANRRFEFSATVAGDNCKATTVVWTFQPRTGIKLTPRPNNGVVMDRSNYPNMTVGSTSIITLAASGNTGCAAEATYVVTITSMQNMQGGLFERSILGMEWAGAASAELKNRVVADFYISAPLLRSKKESGSPLWDAPSSADCSTSRGCPARV